MEKSMVSVLVVANWWAGKEYPTTTNVKSGGINVQIVLGNGNLGLATLMTRRGERL
jgi:hypothetical protein